MADTANGATIATTIERFLNDAMVSTRGTRKTYRTALNALMEYVQDKHELDPAQALVTDLTVERLLAWATWLIDRRALQRRTMQTYLAALTSYVKFLHVNNLIDLPSNQAVRLTEGQRQIRRAQRPPQSVPHPPTAEQIEKILKAVRERVIEPGNERLELARLRNIAIVETLRSTGLRVAELCNLRRKQLRQDKSAWVIGKGGKEREVFFDNTAWRAIQTYVEARRMLDGASGRPQGELPVFARHDKRASNKVLKITTTSVERLFVEIMAAAGLSDAGITPHSLRHYFATKVYQATHDLGVTQTILGHSSPVTTRIYAKLEDGALRAAHEAAFGSPKGPLNEER